MSPELYQKIVDESWAAHKSMNQLCLDTIQESLFEEQDMTFRQVVLEWRARADKNVAKKLDKFCKEAVSHPRLWRMAESMTLTAYERKTGYRVVGTPDWSTILDWLVTNGPAVLKLILSLVALFG